MACRIINLDQGDGRTMRAIVCGPAPKVRNCKTHGEPLNLLCDWKVADGKTCDAPLCFAGSHSPAPGKDLCDAHWAQWQEVLHKRRIVACRSCGAQIIWFNTDKGRNVPIDAESVKPEDTEYHYGRHVAHFATCPNADQHRRPR